MLATIFELLLLWFALSLTTALVVGRLIYHGTDNSAEDSLADARTIRPAA